MSMTFKTSIQFRTTTKGRKQLTTEATPVVATGRIPWISKFMALAIRFDGLIRSGVVADQAALARLGRVTRARMTQIMNLLQLAPDIQEELLFLPRIERGRELIVLRDLLPIAAEPDWRKQRKLWKELLGKKA